MGKILSFFSINFLSHFLFFLFIEFTLVLGGGFLVLLVFRDKIVHVGLGLSELHLVHTLTSIPMQESFTPEHSSELFRDTLEELLDGGGVANEGGGHLEATGRDVANGGLDVVGDPFNKVRAILVLDVEHLLIDLLHGHAATEDCGHGQVPSMSGIAGSHHVLGIEHLLSKLGHGQSPVLLASPGGEGSKARDEEVKTGEGHHVDCQLPEISVQLAREAEAGSNSRHGKRDQVIEIAICGGGELQGAEADVIEGLIVNTVGLVCVLDELMDGEGGVVGFQNGV